MVFQRKWHVTSDYGKCVQPKMDNSNDGFCCCAKCTKRASAFFANRRDCSDWLIGPNDGRCHRFDGHWACYRFYDRHAFSLVSSILLNLSTNWIWTGRNSVHFDDDWLIRWQNESICIVISDEPNLMSLILLVCAGSDSRKTSPSCSINENPFRLHFIWLSVFFPFELWFFWWQKWAKDTPIERMWFINNIFYSHLALIGRMTLLENPFDVWHRLRTLSLAPKSVFRLYSVVQGQRKIMTRLCGI